MNSTVPMQLARISTRTGPIEAALLRSRKVIRSVKDRFVRAELGKLETI